MTNPRYIVQHTTDGDAILWDNEKGGPVLTGTGQIYEAPISAVQWTADTMNQRWSAKAFRDANPLTPETAPDVSADLADTRPEPAHMDSPIEPDAMMSVEEQARLLNVPVETLRGDESKARPRPVSPMTAAVLRIQTEPENLADWERELLDTPEPVTPNPAALLHVIGMTMDKATGQQTRATAARERREAREAREAARVPSYSETFDAMEAYVDRAREDADRRVADANDRALSLARKLGKLEAEVHSVRNTVVGVLAGLFTIPEGYPDLKATLAVEDLEALRDRLDQMITEF